MRLAAGGAQIGERVLVDREEAAGRAIFRGHIADGRLVLQRQPAETGAEEFDEFPHHALLAQHLRDGEHQIGGGNAFAQSSGHAEADHFGDDHRDRLAEHGGLRLDAADAPPQNREAVDHGGVAVGADQRIGECLRHFSLGADNRLCPDRLRQIFQVDLMADAGAGRHDAEIIEGAGAPAQELVALLVARIFHLDIRSERHAVAEGVHHHRMVDDQIDRHQRVDLGRIAAHGLHCVAHRGQIDHGRNAGKVLHQHARRAEGDLALGFMFGEPGGHGLDVGGLDRLAVLEAQQVLQQHLQREGQARNPQQTVLFRFRQTEIFIVLALHIQGAAAIEAVGGGYGQGGHWRASSRLPRSTEMSRWHHEYS